MLQNLPFIIILLVIIFCRFQTTRATQALSTEDKAKVLDNSNRPARYLLFFIFVVVVVLGIFYLNYEVKSINNYMVFVVIMGLIFIVFLGLGVWFRIAYYRRLKKLGLPKTYIRTVIFWHAVSFLAIIAFFITIYNMKDTGDDGLALKYSLLTKRLNYPMSGANIL